MLKKDNVVVNKSTSFAIRIIALSDFLEGKRRYVLARQILKSGTSVGANIRESIYAQSTADFISKLSIALKEASETEYWLELLEKANIVEQRQIAGLKNECTELLKLLTTIIKRNKEKK